MCRRNRRLNRLKRMQTNEVTGIKLEKCVEHGSCKGCTFAYDIKNCPRGNENELLCDDNTIWAQTVS
jgi:hypothetical protein